MEHFSKNSSKYILALLITVLFFYPLVSAPVLAQSASVNTTSVGLAKVAPGELLPISVKLANFGGGSKADVTITYGIFDSQGNQVTIATETVAVQTTASFIKNIQIPFGTRPGKYIAKASLVYQDQLVPATTQFSFTVENKMFGLFVSDFYFYFLWVVIIALLTAMVVYIWMRKRRSYRLSPHEYTQIPKKDRIYYEIISDTIMQMRLRVGDKALVIAKNIDNLVIDQNNGRVLEVKVNPATIVAQLISSYETLLGQKVSFAIKKADRSISEQSKKVDKDLVVIKK